MATAMNARKRNNLTGLTQSVIVTDSSSRLYCQY